MPTADDQLEGQHENAARVLREAAEEQVRLEAAAKREREEAEAERLRHPTTQLITREVLNHEKIVELALNFTKEEAEAAVKQNQKVGVDGRTMAKASNFFSTDLNDAIENGIFFNDRWLLNYLKGKRWEDLNVEETLTTLWEFAKFEERRKTSEKKVGGCGRSCERFA